MPLGTAISLSSLAIAGAAFILSRRDVQSKTTKEELESMRKQIGSLSERIANLEDENVGLRNENLRLMRTVFNCPTEDCPLLKPGGVERRAKER